MITLNCSRTPAPPRHLYRRKRVVMRTALEDVIQRAHLGLQLAAGLWGERRQRLRQHVTVLQRIAAGTPGVNWVLQKTGDRLVNGKFPLHQSAGHRARPQA
ncbi:hypothetical protein [Micromonospora sp. RTP1Z1]|uniref:hypothetical protein n=1 Tax=Micromonospora sp. RTP1Z1 TaxID=2994043 RepID=UPI0029C8133E|nr:hypothetical protein [Micromonospora sp. RTP1Z1]